MSGLGPWNRRQFLGVSGLAAATAALAGCASEPGNSPGTSKAPAGGTGAAPKETFQKPSTKISGSLSILLWSHFVPQRRHLVRQVRGGLGQEGRVDVRVDHIALADVPAQIASEIQAGQGHDMMQYIATLSQFEPGVLDMKDVTDEADKRFGQQLQICKESSFNPNTGTYYAFAPGWVPDPGNYRKSLWEPVGMANGPSTWDDLLTGTTEIKKSKGIQVGLGMSQELDSNMATHALMWSFGGSVQDANEKSSSTRQRSSPRSST